MNIWTETYILKLSFSFVKISKNLNKQTVIYELTAKSFNLKSIWHKAFKLKIKSVQPTKL